MEEFTREEIEEAKQIVLAGRREQRLLELAEQLLDRERAAG